MRATFLPHPARLAAPMDPTDLAPGVDARQAPHPRVDIAAWILAGATLLLVLRLHLLPALLAGLLIFQLVHMMAPLLARHIASQRAKLFAVALLSTLVVGAVTAAIVALVAFLRSDAGSLPALFKKMADIIEGSRSILPGWLLAHLPSNAQELQEALAGWLRRHGTDVQLAGKEAGRVFAQILIGMVIGAMLSLHEVLPVERYRPLARSLMERARRLADAFRRIVFAQVRISAVNTLFTALYLAALLPLLGVKLPLTKTLIAVTFVAGLLPVIGNLISNTVIVVVSLSHSLPVALGSLAFLVVIHKLEYFLNARIVGTQIRARAWELLLAMLAMEAAFGLPGVVAAPIYYAYLKDELTRAGLV